MTEEGIDLVTRKEANGHTWARTSFGNRQERLPNGVPRFFKKVPQATLFLEGQNLVVRPFIDAPCSSSSTPILKTREKSGVMTVNGAIFLWGSFINHVDRILDFLTNPSPFVDHFT